MSGTAGNTYLHREFYPEGQDAEVGYPRGLGKNHTEIGKKSVKLFPFLKIFCYAHRFMLSPTVMKEGS